MNSNTLSAEKGINVGNDASLTIYGQTNGTGQLNAGAENNNQVDDYQAGIGGGNGDAGGKITINGGKVTAYGGAYAAGIGGGNRGAGGTVTINGGEVTAKGGKSGAGIGGGNGGAGGRMVLNGGTVTAAGGNGGAGIGGGNVGAGGDIELNVGTVTATGGTGGAALGGGSGSSTQGTLFIDDGASTGKTIKAGSSSPGEDINATNLMENHVDGYAYLVLPTYALPQVSYQNCNENDHVVTFNDADCPTYKKVAQCIREVPSAGPKYRGIQPLLKMPRIWYFSLEPSHAPVTLM